MKFNFINQDGQVVEINVICFIGPYSSEAGYLNNRLKQEVQPIRFETAKKIFDECKEHAQQQYEYGYKITTDAPHSSTASSYRRMMHWGLRGDNDFDAMSRVMKRLITHVAQTDSSSMIDQAIKYIHQCILDEKNKAKKIKNTIIDLANLDEKEIEKKIASAKEAASAEPVVTFTCENTYLV